MVLPADKYSVYDGMTFPHVPPITFSQKFKEFFHLKSQENLHFPSHDLAQSECLQAYLARYGEILRNLKYSALSGPKFLECVNEIYHIFQQLHQKNLCSLSGVFEFLYAYKLPKV
jgi:hypothetical protein